MLRPRGPCGLGLSLSGLGFDLSQDDSRMQQDGTDPPTRHRRAQRSSIAFHVRAPDGGRSVPGSRRFAAGAVCDEANSSDSRTSTQPLKSPTPDPPPQPPPAMPAIPKTFAAKKYARCFNATPPIPHELESSLHRAEPCCCRRFE